jgi:hypothetical protein
MIVDDIFHDKIIFQFAKLLLGHLALHHLQKQNTKQSDNG